MGKILTIEEALADVRGKVNKKGEVVPNQFNKKKFNKLLLAFANDPDFKYTVEKTVGGKVETEEIMPTKEFRKFCKKLVEKAGVDSHESEFVLTPEFTLDNIDGLYDFFTAAVYEYLNAGNKFDFPRRTDFKGSIILKDVEENSKVRDARNPRDGSYLGKFKTTEKKHKKLVAKSPCPDNLKEKSKL